MDKQIHPVDLLVGQRVRVLRLSRGLSQTALANELGVSFQQLQKYENGTNRISASKLFMIATALHVPVASLFDDAIAAQGDGNEARDASSPSSDDLKIVGKLAQLPDGRLKGRVLDFITALTKAQAGDKGAPEHDHT